MSRQDENTGWGKLTKIAVGLTGVLVVLPALINSAKDVYGAIHQLPRTEAERLNVEFFKKYWGKKPLGELPLVISRDGSSYKFSVTVYEEGDLSVQYGNKIQWFAFPGQSATLSDAGFLISSTYADGSRYRSFDGELERIQQFDSIQGSNAVRENVYRNGVRERQVIDIRTGVVVDQTFKESAVPGTDDTAYKMPPSLTIDLNAPDPKFELLR
ncbi:hypothetical protein C4K04_2587 [Pseudomonas chlororaphis]|uniref:Uncharacterized protein n=1 Tax=Pseudomonas chlororaphis TaxID=587753 RepID=A0A3G7TML2_9PSED|nr:hypothetical protein [Pseudomonas chlororaphis]AZE48260.1 hypothetical protein C4K04_2587 [Pseudomonas chlororaphis]